MIGIRDSIRDLTRLELRPGDIVDAEEVRQASERTDLVFHMAVSTSFDPGRKRRQWRANIEGTRNILEAVRRSTSIRRVCCTSTVNALGVPTLCTPQAKSSMMGFLSRA